MDLLTIGEFARASRLSPKALRLYDELGLLVPARVDPASGYRWYEPSQLERARLVAWLRRLGMPLEQIRAIADLAPAQAAQRVSAFWAGVEVDVAARRELAAALVDRLTGKDDAMTGTLRIRYAQADDQGLVREHHQDAVHACDTVLVVADGFGADGAAASRAAVRAVADAVATVATAVTAVTASVADLLNTLHDAAVAADAAVGSQAAVGPEGETLSGTTLTALMLDGSRLGLVHIGDSRAYLLRDGALARVTHDHSSVQALVDDGTITAEEARSHPDRALLLRALDGRGSFAPHTDVLKAQTGDRYLLCSDGLWSVVPDDDLQLLLAAAVDPAAAVEDLLARVRDAGAPDNVAVAVADVLG